MNSESWIKDNLTQITQAALQTIERKRKREFLQLDKIQQFKQQSIKPLYPHLQDQQSPGKIRKYTCCELISQSPGMFCCCKSKDPDDSYKKFGLGLCLYVKYIKHSILFYFFMSLFAFFSCSICFLISTRNNINPIDSYTNFFYASTYGVISSQKIKCQYFLINKITKIVNASLTCPYGKITFYNSSYLPIVFTNESMNNLYNCRNEKKKLINNQDKIYEHLNVLSQKQMKFNLNSSSASINLVFDGSQTNNLVSIVYQCNDNIYPVGNSSVSGQRCLYILTAIDYLFVLGFLIFLLSEYVSEQRQQNNFKKNQTSLNDFSVQIVNISRAEAEYKFYILLDWLSQFSFPMYNDIVNISISQISKQIEYWQEKNNTFKQLSELIQNQFFQFYNEAQNDIRIKKQGENPIYLQKMGKMLKYINEGKNDQLLYTSKQKISLFIVFNKMQSKQKLMLSQQQSCLRNKLTIHKFDRQWQYQIRQGRVPDMILWKNRGYNTYIRTIFCWLITIGICLSSYILFGYIQYKQNQLLARYNYEIDCLVLYKSEDLLTYNVILDTASDYYLTCYCKKNSISDVFSDVSSYCKEWKKQYILYLAIPLLISLGIVMYNVIVSKIFKIMSFYEKHKYNQNYQLSYTYKKAFLLIMNMGLIMILLNINYRQDLGLKSIGFMFLGRYDDFTADWYYNIGSTIILTCIFNISFPIIQFLLASLGKCLLKCIDTKCYSVPTSKQTKKQFTQLYNYDKFQIGQRYAYLLATLLISISFCGIMPILIPVAFFSLLLLYWIDKFLIFKIFQTPLNYTSTLHNSIFKIISFSLLIHCFVCMYFLSEVTMRKDSYISLSQQYIKSNNERINAIMNTNYILPYVVVLIIGILFIVLRLIFLKIFYNCYKACKKTLFNDIRMDGRLSLYSIFSKHQQRLLKQTLNVQQQKITFFQKQHDQYIRRTGQRQDSFLNLHKRQRQLFYRQHLKIINKTRQQLERNPIVSVQERKQQFLIGIPSYDRFVANDTAEEYQDLILFQKKLKNIWKQSYLKSRNIDNVENTNSATYIKDKYDL